MSNKTGITVYMTTYDAYPFIIPAATYMFNKYWGDQQPVKLLGFKKPKHKLPKNFEFISMGTDPKHANKWTRFIHDTIKKEAKDEEYLVHLLDDHLLTDYFNIKIFKDLLGRMKADKKVLRCGLGFGPSLRSDTYEIIDSKPDYDVYELDQTAEYRVTGQSTLWRKSYLLKCMDNDWTPWQFELINSENAKNDGNRVLGTARDYAFRWSEHGLLSGRNPKGKVNILGIPPEDIKHLIKKGILIPENLQYGQGDDIPRFVDIGYDFDFELLKTLKTPQRLWELEQEYGGAYTRG